MYYVLHSTVLKMAVHKNIDVSTNWTLQRLIIKMNIIESKTNLVIQCHVIWGEYSIMYIIMYITVLMMVMLIIVGQAGGNNYNNKGGGRTIRENIIYMYQ